MGSRVGVFGHSMGGMSTLRITRNGLFPDVPLLAAVAQHPCYDQGCNTTDIKVPMMITTGTKDRICPAAIAQNVYKYLPHARVLFNIQGAPHNEPLDSPPVYGNRADIPSGIFLACHIRGDHCDLVYGPDGLGAKGAEICNSGATHPYSKPFTLAECQVDPVGYRPSLEAQEISE